MSTATSRKSRRRAPEAPAPELVVPASGVSTPSAVPARSAVSGGVASVTASSMVQTAAMASRRARSGLAELWQQSIWPVLRRVLRPLRIITPLGAALICVVLVAGALALWFGWAEMAAIAALGLAALVVAVPFVVGRSRFEVGVELASPRVVVGESAVGRVLVRNAGARASAPLRIEFPVGRARAEFRLPRLAPGAEHDELFTIPTSKRAVLSLGPVSSVRTDPIGVLRREVPWSEPTELYVHPRIVSLPGDTTGFMRDLEGLPTRDLADDDVSFHALREYTPGDDLRHVHWRSSARTSTLMIRQFEQTRRSHLVLALSTRAADYSSAEEFELAVSTVGSIGVTALRDDKALTVVTSIGPLATPTANQLLDRLSAVEMSDAASGPADVARTVARMAGGASVVMFATGAATSRTDLRAAAVRIPSTARGLCVRAATEESLSRRALGDLVVVSVPQLSDLRAAVRAVDA